MNYLTECGNRWDIWEVKLPEDVYQAKAVLGESYLEEIRNHRSSVLLEEERCLRVEEEEIRTLLEDRDKPGIVKQEISEKKTAQEAAYRVALVRQEEHRIWFATNVFGAEKWGKYFGDVGEEPPLPSNIRQIMLAPCPIWPDKRIEETHKLVLVPEKVNGKALTLQYLEELVKAPRQGNYSTKYRNNQSKTLQKHGEKPSKKSHWVLMTRDVLPGSLNESDLNKEKMVHRLSGGYRVPLLLEAVVCVLMEYVETGVHLFGTNPCIYTSCKELVSYSLWQTIIGDFGASGLDINFHRGLQNPFIGLAALREIKD